MRLICISIVLFLFHPDVIADTTHIHGQISDLPTNSEPTFATAVIRNLVRGHLQVRREVAEDGIFALSFDLNNSQDVFLKVGDFGTSLLLNPGDSIECKWVYSPNSMELSSLHFSGDGADRNRHFVNMMHQHWQNIDFDNDEHMWMGTKYRLLDPEEFLFYRMRKKQEQENLLIRYLHDNDIRDSLLLKWVNYFTTFQPINNLLGYPIIHSQMNNMRTEDLVINQSYYDFLNEVNTNDRNALICSEFIMFLNRDFYMHFRMRSQMRPEYRKLVDRDGMVATHFNYMKDGTTDLAREVILTRFLLEMMELKESISSQVPPLMEEFYSLVKDKSFIKAVMKKYQLRYDEKSELKPRQHLNLLDFPENGDSLMPSLVNRFVNKVIYIDIWATWCGPCLKGMEFYLKLIERYKDQDLVFVFLAAHSPESLWKKRINEFNLTGHHYLLNEKQYYNLERYFELHGFPQHVIIDRTGQIVESKGPPIYNLDGTLNQDLLSLLNDLLER